jgi:Ca-activated chloride channel family protein
MTMTTRMSLACALAGLVVAAAGAALGDTPGRLVSKGIHHYNREDYAKAIDLYDLASVKAPESAIVAFDRGDALYKKGDYEKAREQFQDAASKSKSLPFEAKAWYNLGNCAFKEGGRQEDSDLQKALESYQESVKLYGTSLEKDPKLRDAAENMEIARLKIKDLLDRIKNQQQGKQGQSQQQNQQNRQQNQQQQSQKNQQQQNQQGQKQDQQQQQQQQAQQGQDQQQSQQPKQAGAENKDQKQNQGKDKQAAGDKGKEVKELPRDATASKILDEEKQNRKDRQREEAGGYRPVEKDW